MRADSLAENTPNAPEFICPSQKILDLNKKKSLLYMLIATYANNFDILGKLQTGYEKWFQMA